jgi:hypothetical protein
VCRSLGDRRYTGKYFKVRPAELRQWLTYLVANNDQYEGMDFDERLSQLERENPSGEVDYAGDTRVLPPGAEGGGEREDVLGSSRGGKGVPQTLTIRRVRQPVRSDSEGGDDVGVEIVTERESGLL